MKMGFDAAWDDNPVNVTAEVNMIWSIANRLRGPYQHEKFKDVIIPMTIIRRFECALEPYKKAVVDYAAKHVEAPEQKLFQLSHYKFYNRSPLSLKELCNDADNIAGNFREYIAGFSSRVQEILSSLEFNTQITKMDKGNCLLSVVKAFSEVDLNPKTIDTMKMGYIFEDLIRRFSENAEAGDHYTGRDIIKLMVTIALHGQDDVREPGKVITVCDQASGTGGMLSTAYNFIRHYNPEAEVALYGQEINPESYAMCLAEMMIKGQNADNIRLQDTMKKDCFPKQKMRFVIENPPFGTPWGGKDAKDGVEDAVKEEFLKGKDRSRWGAGLPGSGDMQMLFVQSAIDKLEENGRAVIVEDGSPLFAGGPSSGENAIRKWLIDNDLLEAIIALPTELFYNTPLATFLWVISKKKTPVRKGKVQFIDARSFCKVLNRPLGKKRKEIMLADRKRILDLYSKFSTNTYSLVFDNNEMTYREYCVKPPMRRNYRISNDRIEHLLAADLLSFFYSPKEHNDLQLVKLDLDAKGLRRLKKLETNKPIYEAIVRKLKNAVCDEQWDDALLFEEKLTSVLASSKVDSKVVRRLVSLLSMVDRSAKIQLDVNGEVVYDDELADVEIVPAGQDIEEYMRENVLPHMPNAKAFFEENLDAKRPVIRTGVEFPFTRLFFSKQITRFPADIRKDIEGKERNAQFLAEGAKIRCHEGGVGRLYELCGAIEARQCDVAALKNLLDELTQIRGLLREFKRAKIFTCLTRGVRDEVRTLKKAADWIGEIPAGWKEERIGAYYLNRNIKVSDKDYAPLSVTMAGILPQLDTVAKTDDGDNRKLVCVGDFVINSRSDRRGSCGVSALTGSVSLINTILEPYEKIYSGYYNLLFRCPQFSDEFYKWGHGIAADLWTTRWQEMKKIRIPVPPYEEQAEIAKYIICHMPEWDREIYFADERINQVKNLILLYEVGGARCT